MPERQSLFESRRHRRQLPGDSEGQRPRENHLQPRSREKVLMRARVLIWAILVTHTAILLTGAAFAGTKELPHANMGTMIDSGFDQLYRLNFSEARSRFFAYENAHSDDPLGETSIAASYLFEELFLQHVFTSDYFLDDRRLLGGAEGRPDAVRAANFRMANQRARDLARKQLESRPENADALFALTLAAGMQADYASILEKRQLESLRLIKEANDYAQRLIKLRPDTADAWLSIGAANYIIGCLPAHTRFFLWFGGIRGDKPLGMEQLRKTAEYGRYLRPFAKIFLALAALREGQREVARQQFSDLATQFPDNPLFADELARINTGRIERSPE
jgi:tetratricopeptide (TPR) repeat protein